MIADPRTNPLAQVMDEVVRLKTRLQGVFSGAAAVTGLSTTEITLLAAVIEAKRPPTVPQIGRSLGQHRQVIQRAAKALIDQGLLETSLNPDHKRAHLLSATSLGLERYRGARIIGDEAAQGFLETIDRQECEQLALAMQDLRHRIEVYLRADRKLSR